jgi:hypothetical protein
MATKKTIELEVNTNAEQAKKGIDDLGQSVDNLNQAEKKVQKTNKDLHASFEEVYGEVKPLTAQMGEMEDRLYQMALAGDTASKEFNELLTEVGKYRKVQIDTDLAVDAAAGNLSEKLGGALQGAASGFAMAQGTMALFGTESEELEKTLVKVQAAMALAEGVRGLREGAKSFKALGMAAKKAFTGMRAGFAATGIGVFLVALGTVIAYWDDIAEAIGFASDNLEELEERQAKLNKELAKSEKLTDASIGNIETYQLGYVKAKRREIELMEIAGKSEKEIFDAKVHAQETEITALKQIAEKRRANFSEASKQSSIGSQEYENALAKMRQSNDALIDSENRLEVLRAQNFAEVKKRWREMIKQAFENRKRRREEIKERRAFNLQIERELEDLRIAQLKESYDKEVILINTQAKRIREDILANDKLTSTQRTELLVEQERIRQGKIIALGQRRGEVEFEQMEVRGAAEIELHAKIEDKKLQITKDYDETRKQQAQQTAQAVANIAIDGLRLVSDIADMFASKDEKLAKRAFNIKKAADIAEATMSGYKAVVSTYANAPGGVVLKSIQAAIAGAFSAVQIAKIASAKFGGGQVASDLGDTSAGAGGGSMPQPSFNVVGDSGINQLAELQMQPTQAFVVSGDITTAQSLDRNKIQNATI